MQEIVFLGIFDKVANWIMSGISKVLTWLVTNIIAPVCSIIWENCVKYIVDFLAEILAIFVYKLYALILTILYAIEKAVYSFAGAVDVHYQGETTNLLSLLFKQSPVSKAFWYITAMSVTLLFVFTIVSVVRSTLDFQFDGKRSIGNIMTSFLTGAITFLILPAFCYGLIELTSICMKALFTATSASGTSSLTDNLFMLSVKSNITDDNFVKLASKINETEMFWHTFDNVKPYIDYAKNVDYVIGIIGAVVLIVNLLIMSATFIQRVIEIVVLYIVSPFFTATMPLDDGERFGKWRRTFIGRLCLGIGMIVSLNIVMMILSIVLNGNGGTTISFTEPVPYTSDVVQSASNKSVDIILKLIFMVGSILSIKTLGSTITSIIEQDAGMAERESYNESKGRLKTATTKTLGAAKFAKDLAKKHMDEQGSKSRGFEGDLANDDEKKFVDSIKKQNRKNSSKAAFTRRGMKYSALKSATERGDNALSEFTKLKTHEERKSFMENFNKSRGMDALKVDGDKLKPLGKGEMTSIKERKALNNLDKRIAMAKANRGKAKPNSKEWKKHDSELKRLNGLKNEFDMLNTHNERDKFIKAHGELSAFKAEESKENKKAGKKEKAFVNSISKKKSRLDMKKSFSKRGAAMTAYKSKIEQADNILNEFNSLGTHEEKAAFMKKFERDGGLSQFDVSPLIGVDSESTSLKERRAISNLNANKLTALNNRNMFKKGSAEWNMFNEEINSYNKLSDQLDSMDTRAERDALIESNPAFSKSKMTSFSESRALDKLDSNIKTAVVNRNRHKVGSDKWNECNNRVKSLVLAKAQLNSIGSHEGRADFISSNSEAFSFNLDDDKNFQHIEQSYSAWKAMESMTSDPAMKEHAHKMAKAYADFSYEYSSSKSQGTSRAVVAQKMADFEEKSLNSQGIGLTAKECAAYSRIEASQNEPMMKAFMTASSHSERKAVVDSFDNYVSQNGKMPEREEVLSSSESDFVRQIQSTANISKTMAESNISTPEQKAMYTDVENFCEEAGRIYSSLKTHSQRENFAKVITESVSQRTRGIENELSVPQMAPSDMSEYETSFSGNLSSAEKKTFKAIPTHRERYAYMDNYYMNSSSALQFDEGERSFYNDFISGSESTEYEETAQYRTRFLGAASHEERTRIMQDYGNYVANSDSSHAPGNWGHIVIEEPAQSSEPEAAASIDTTPKPSEIRIDGQDYTYTVPPRAYDDSELQRQQRAERLSSLRGYVDQTRPKRHISSSDVNLAGSSRQRFSNRGSGQGGSES